MVHLIIIKLNSELTSGSATFSNLGWVATQVARLYHMYHAPMPGAHAYIIIELYKPNNHAQGPATFIFVQWGKLWRGVTSCHEYK